MIEIVPFQAFHLEMITLQGSQQFMSPLLTKQYGQALQHAGSCWTAFAGTHVIACAGVVWFWEGRAQVWSLLSMEMSTYRKSIHKAVKGFLENYRIARLECIVDPRSVESMRWAEHLGFHLERPMPKYNPDGSTQLMYVRIE